MKELEDFKREILSYRWFFSSWMSAPRFIFDVGHKKEYGRHYIILRHKCLSSESFGQSRSMFFNNGKGRFKIEEAIEVSREYLFGPKGPTLFKSDEELLRAHPDNTFVIKSILNCPGRQ